MDLDADAVNTAAEQEFDRLRTEESLHGDEAGNAMLHGVRFNALGADYFMADIYQSLSDLYGDGTGGILFQTGEGYGEHLLELVTADDPSTRFGQFLGLLTFLGYSRVRMEDDAIVVPSSPTADEYAQTDHPPQQVCYFLAGVLSGAATACCGGEQRRFVEDQCVGNGADRCVFRLRDTT